MLSKAHIGLDQDLDDLVYDHENDAQNKEFPAFRLLCGWCRRSIRPLLHTSHPERLRFTPHIAWASHESLERLVRMMADNIRETMGV